MKMARCIQELERIYGIRQGSANNKEVNQYIGGKDNLIPELQELVNNEALSVTTAYKIWAKMPEEEQEKFLQKIKNSIKHVDTN